MSVDIRPRTNPEYPEIQYRLLEDPLDAVGGSQVSIQIPAETYTPPSPLAQLLLIRTKIPSEIQSKIFKNIMDFAKGKETSRKPHKRKWVALGSVLCVAKKYAKQFPEIVLNYPGLFQDWLKGARKPGLCLQGPELPSYVAQPTRISHLLVPAKEPGIFEKIMGFASGTNKKWLRLSRVMQLSKFHAIQAPNIFANIPETCHLYIKRVCQEQRGSLNLMGAFWDPEKRDRIKVLDLSDIHISAENFCILFHAFPNIERLNLSGSNITDQALLSASSPKHLRELILTHCKSLSIKGFRAFTAQRNLRVLDLTGCGQVDNDWVDCLAGFTNLRELYLSYCWQIHPNNLCYLFTKFPDLEKLYLDHSTAVDNEVIQGLDRCEHLQELNLSDCFYIKSESFTVFPKLKELKTLFLDDFDIQMGDNLLSLAECASLRKLTLFNMWKNDPNKPVVKIIRDLIKNRLQESLPQLEILY